MTCSGTLKTFALPEFAGAKADAIPEAAGAVDVDDLVVVPGESWVTSLLAQAVSNNNPARKGIKTKRELNLEAGWFGEREDVI